MWHKHVLNWDAIEIVLRRILLVYHFDEYFCHVKCFRAVCVWFESLSHIFGFPFCSLFWSVSTLCQYYSVGVCFLYFCFVQGRRSRHVAQARLRSEHPTKDHRFALRRFACVLLFLDFFFFLAAYFLPPSPSSLNLLFLRFAFLRLCIKKEVFGQIFWVFMCLYLYSKAFVSSFFLET